MPWTSTDFPSLPVQDVLIQILHVSYKLQKDSIVLPLQLSGFKSKEIVLIMIGTDTACRLVYYVSVTEFIQLWDSIGYLEVKQQEVGSGFHQPGLFLWTLLLSVVWKFTEISCIMWSRECQVLFTGSHNYLRPKQELGHTLVSPLLSWWRYGWCYAFESHQRASQAYD